MPEWREPTIRDTDRLPWLESAETDYRRGPSFGRIFVIALVIVGVVLALILGIHAYRTRPGSDGGGALINAQEGDYKVKPDDPGGTKVTGEGDTAMATSDGSGAGNASINLNAVPETPIAGTKTANAPNVNGGATKTVAAVPASGGKLTPAPAAVPIPAHGSSGGALVQLGSFPDEATANAAWARASKRFDYLAPLGKSVVKAEVNGKTVYRLRVNTGSAGSASELCGKLKVAGEACFVAND